MPTPLEQTPASRPGSPFHGSLGLLVAGWVSAALVLVALPLGWDAGAAVVAAQGYGVDEVEPPGVGLLGWSVFAAIVLLPVAAAGWFGHRAAQAGRRSGATAAMLALTVGGGLVVVGLAAHLSRVLGWPLALAGVGLVCGLALYALVLRRRHRPSAQPRKPVNPPHDPRDRM